MANVFDITPVSSETVTLGRDRKTRFMFKVTNPADTTVRAILEVVPLTMQDAPPATKEVLAPLDKKWLTVADEKKEKARPPGSGAAPTPGSAVPGASAPATVAPGVLEFRPMEARQIAIDLEVPSGAKPGLYQFKLVAREEGPGARSAASPPVGFKVPETAAAGKPKWPLVLAAVAGVVVIGLGITFALTAFGKGDGTDSRPDVVDTPPVTPEDPTDPPRVATVDVPAVEGTEFSVAVVTVAKAGLTPVRSKVTISADKPEGTVLSQTPKAGEKLATDGVVELEVAGRAVKVPQVTSRLLADAETLITGLDLTWKVVGDKVTGKPPTTVLTQSPAAATSVAPGTVIELTVEGQGAVVPNVVGQSLTDALLTLQRNQLQAAAIETKVDNTKRANTVALQDPKAGARVGAGSKVKLTVWTTKRVIKPFTAEDLEKLRKKGLEQDATKILREGKH